MIQKTFDLKMFGGKKTVALNAYAIEQKVTATDTLCQMIIGMKQKFNPYINRCIENIISNVQYKHSKMIRKNAVIALANLSYCCGEPQQVLQLILRSLPHFINELELQKTPEDVYFILEHMYDLMKPLINANVE
jgi:hypothetical protein